MIKIPNDTNQEWQQANQSDLFGNIHITKNCTFDTEGYLRLSYSPRSVMDESVDTDFNNPAVILFNEDYGYFVETWEEAFQVNESVLSERPTQITTSGVPSGDIQSDAVWFGGLMPVTQNNDVKYYNPAANTWTDTNISLTNTAQSQHQMISFLSRDALAIADVNSVKLYATPLTAIPVLITELLIATDFHITGMCYFNQNLYIATQNRFGGHAYMYVWNGTGTAANQVYEVDSNTIFSICAHQNSIVVLTGNGGLLKFNGAGFDLLAGFPIYYTDQSISDTTNISMYKNILKSNGNLLYILFTNEQNDSNRLLDMPDGVWCYDETIGLYHRYALSNALVKIQSISTVDVTTNQITVASPAVITGTEVVFQQVFGLTPLVNGTKYYVIKIDATHIQLATTLANALAGIPIDLLVSSGSNTYTFFPNVDFGQYFVQRTMSLDVIERPVSNRIFGTDLIWGAEVYRRDAEADYGTLGTVSLGVESRGYFITPKIYSTDVTDNQNLISMKFSPFTTEMDTIVIKYRTVDDMRQFINLSDWDITWTSPTTFTTTQADWATALIGNEVEIITGAGGGLLAHITAISVSTGTYTVTLDETFSNFLAGDVGKAVFRNWIKWKTITAGSSDALQYFISEQLGSDGKFLQLKVELRGVQTRIEKLLIDNQVRLAAKH